MTLPYRLQYLSVYSCCCAWSSTILIGRGYGINAPTSAEVGLAEDKTETSHSTLTLGEEPIEPSLSEVHLGVDRNLAGTLSIAAKVQTGRRTMYALMGAGAYGCSGVTPLLVAHLWNI